MNATDLSPIICRTIAELDETDISFYLSISSIFSDTNEVGEKIDFLNWSHN